jgi:hypothetical protein
MKWGEIIPASWPKDIFFIVGGGASVTESELWPIYGARSVIAVNEAAFLLPHFSAAVSIDHQFMAHRAARLCEIALLCPVYLCPPKHAAQSLQDKIPDAVFLRETSKWDAHGIHRRGGSSGYAALNAAVLMGATRIVLVGFDYKRTGGRKNWHGAYTWPQNENFASWARAFDPLVALFAERGIEVVNASPDSAMTAFPRMTLEQALAHEWRDQTRTAA